MKKHLTVFMLFIIGILTSRAQTPADKTEEILNGQILQTENSMISSLSMIEQQGAENSTISIQEQQGQSLNLIKVQQSGSTNVSYINQTGWELTSRMLQQGHNNEANLWSEGGHVSMDVNQTGNNNVIYSYIKNPSLFEKQAFLLQEGNNNRIELALFGNTMPSNEQSVKITQQGNGFQAKALMETFHTPIEISQTAGAGGGEMKVDVSTSYFSFPMR